MPLVRITLQTGRPPAVLRAIGEAIHGALVSAIGAPAEGRFQVFDERPPGSLVFPPSYLGVPKSEGLVILQITMNLGRTLEQKKALYAQLAERLGRDAGVRPEDLIVSLVEVPRENWSWGRGEATYAK